MAERRGVKVYFPDGSVGRVDHDRFGRTYIEAAGDVDGVRMLDLDELVVTAFPADFNEAA